MFGTAFGVSGGGHCRLAAERQNYSGERSQTGSIQRKSLRSFLIRELPPYFTNTRKRLVRSPKLYLRDSGLLHYLHRITSIDQLLGRPVAGHSWEGYVIEEIIKKGQHQFDFFFYRTQRGAECDLVLCQNMKPLIALEIKLTNAPRTTRGFYESIQDLKTDYNFIITP